MSEANYEITLRDGDVLITRGGISLAEFFSGDYVGGDGLQRAKEFVRLANALPALVAAAEAAVKELESHLCDCESAFAEQQIKSVVGKLTAAIAITRNA